MVEYLKYLKEFLRHDREKYGVAPFALDIPERRAYYGMVHDDLGICDNNSLYLLYDFNPRKLNNPAFKPALDLGNMDDFYYDAMSLIDEDDLIAYGNLELLNDEQRKFLEGFLGSQTDLHMTDSGILIGESAKGKAYIYTNREEAKN